MALFAQVAELAEEMSGTASRLKKRAAIAAAIAAVYAAAPAGEDAGLFAMYLAGTPFAEWDARKLNAGGALLTMAVLAVSGASDAGLTAAYRRHGDLGAAAFDLLGEEFLRNYHRYADSLYRCFMDLEPQQTLDPSRFRFELYASGEYSRMLESQWEGEEDTRD